MKMFCKLATALALVACGDNGNNNPPDPDAPVTPQPDAPVDTPVDPPFTAPTPFAIPLSVAGQDQLQSAVAAPDGKFYAAGFASSMIGAPRFVTVVKYNTNGTPDATFGANGVVTTGLEFFPTGGGADEIDIAVDANGKVVVSATTRAPANGGPPSLDRDIGLVRLNPNGTLDTTFNAAGTPGILVVSLNTALINGTTVTASDASRGLAVDDGNRIYVHAVSRGLGNKADASGNPRTDTDFTLARILADGSGLDTAWGGDQVTFTQGGSPVRTTTAGVGGQFRLDFVNLVGTAPAVPTEQSATPRGVRPLANGKVLVGGYGSSFASGNTTQPVVYKLDANGDLDTTWGVEQGVFHEAVVAFQTEVYNIAFHGTHFTTAGYGRELETGQTNQYISLRFKVDATAGESVRDGAWGGTATGAVLFDPSGNGTGSNCRNAIALPNGKTFMIGSTGAGNMPEQEAVVSILDATGQLDASYGTGIHRYTLAPAANGGDQFWGGAVSGDNVILVGYKSHGTQAENLNDDSFAVVFPIR